MAALVTLVIATVLFGIAIGAFLMVSFAISCEDRTKGSLRFDPSSPAKRAARTLVGISSSRWE